MQYFHKPSIQIVLFAVLCIAFAALAGCSSTIQTTSGEDYIDRAMAAGVDLDYEMSKAAAVEPILKFPARIGIARIERGLLTDIPGDELEKWRQEFSANENDQNEYEPVSLFITDLAISREEREPYYRGSRAQRRRTIIDRLQLGGARQHLDAIFLYEVYGTTSRKKSALAVADLTLIGAYLAPGRAIDAQGHASGLLFDVRNGYPYGTATATISKDALSSAFNADTNQDALLAKSQSAAVGELAVEAAAMMGKLEAELLAAGAARDVAAR